jgi:hypothetical protein
MILPQEALLRIDLLALAALFLLLQLPQTLRAVRQNTLPRPPVAEPAVASERR